MAGKREIKTTLKLEGEQQFKKGMSDAANAIKVLNSEQKLAAAQFEATGDAEQYAADKTRILKEKIAEQQKAVKTAEDAVKALKEQGFDPNSKAMQTWRTKLNLSRAALTRMESELDTTEQALNEQGDAFDGATTDASEYQDELENIGKNVNFQATIEAIDNVRERLGTIIRAAGRAGKALWDLELGGAAWADELKTAADVADMDVETYQAWTYASQMVDTSVDSIIGSYKRLNKNLDEPTDDILHSLNELGVWNLDAATGRARETMDVFWDVVDALGQVENKSRRDQLAMELLGKSFDELNPLIKAGSAAYKDYIEEGRLTAVSEENVNALGELDDANNRLTASFTKTKETLLAEFAEPFETVAGAITDALNSFNDFLETTEGQEALSDLKGALLGLADEIKGVNWQDAMDKASAVIKKITDSLAWLLSHKTLVIGAIAGMGGAWVGLTVSKDVLSVLQLLNTIKWSQISSVASSGASAGAGAGAGAAAKALSGLSGGIGVAGPVAALVGAGIAGQKMIQANLESEALNAVYGNNAGEGGVVEAMSEESLRRAKEYWKVYSDAAMAGTEEAMAAREKLFDSLEKEGYEQTEQAVSLLENAFDNYLNETDPDGLIEKIEQRNSSFFDPNAELPAPDTSGFTEAMDTVVSTGESTADAMPAIGGNIAAGLAQGIYDRGNEAIQAATWLSNAVAGATRSILAIKSPSRVMRGLGEYVSEGFALGIEENIARVERATSRMVAATTRGVETAPAGAQGATRGGGSVHIPVYIDGQQLVDVIAPMMDSSIGMIVAKRR